MINSEDIIMFKIKIIILGVIIIGGLMVSIKLLGKRFLIFILGIFVTIIFLVVYMIYGLISMLVPI